MIDKEYKEGIPINESTSDDELIYITCHECIGRSNLSGFYTPCERCKKIPKISKDLPGPLRIVN